MTTRFCSNVASLLAACRSAKPGDDIVLADGTYHGNLDLGSYITGNGKGPITIRGESKGGVVIIATDKTKSAIVTGAAKFLNLKWFVTHGGLNGIQVSQNGTDYTELKMIRGIHIFENEINDPIKDGIKVNGGSDVHVDFNVINHGVGNDQAIDMLGIADGTIRGNKITSPNGLAGILNKGGCQRIHILSNTVDAKRCVSIGGPLTVPSYPASDGMQSGILIQDNDFHARLWTPLYLTAQAGDVAVTGNRTRWDKGRYAIENHCAAATFDVPADQVANMIGR